MHIFQLKAFLLMAYYASSLCYYELLLEFLNETYKEMILN